jgi:hypothetical protein
MATLKLVVSPVTAFQLRQVALRDGRSLSETLRRLVERGMMTVAPVDMPDAVVDKIERGAGKVMTPAYLQGPLAAIIRRLAVEQDRSQSWIVRDLIRCEYAAARRVADAAS